MEAAPLRYHWLRLRAFVHATEDPAKVEAAIRTVAGDPELDVGRTEVEGHHGGRLLILEATLDTSRLVKEALARLLAIPGARGDLEATLDPRTDEEGILHLRLDKQEAAQGRLALTRGEDAVQVRVKANVHPVTRAKAMAAWKRWLEK